MHRKDRIWFHCLKLLLGNKTISTFTTCPFALALLFVLPQLFFSYCFLSFHLSRLRCAPCRNDFHFWINEVQLNWASEICLTVSIAGLRVLHTSAVSTLHTFRRNVRQFRYVYKKWQKQIFASKTKLGTCFTKHRNEYNQCKNTQRNQKLKT